LVLKAPATLCYSVAVNNPLFRPPAEADSLILQIDQGCPHNRCLFCGMYRGVKIRRLPVDDVRALIKSESRRNAGAQRAFLADADVMGRPFAELQTILLLLNEAFPSLTRVSLYANGRSIAAKSRAELGALRSLKMHTLYMGLESGDDEILGRCHKGETASQMVSAGIEAQAAGLRMSVMVLLGLGGIEKSHRHIAHTATALNRMQPRLLSALRVIPIPGTELHDEVAHGRFCQLTEWDVVREMRDLTAHLELTSTVFRANHSSNVVPLEARFPKDKDRLLAELQSLLDSGRLSRTSPGPMPLWL
jgi:radical SAM superfamily enzyme YgiQ (UPF0313 family)